MTHLDTFIAVAIAIVIVYGEIRSRLSYRRGWRRGADLAASFVERLERPEEIQEADASTVPLVVNNRNTRYAYLALVGRAA